MNQYRQCTSSRSGAIVVLSALLMIVIFGLTAFAIDIGYMMLMRSQLQVSADAGAMAAGNSLHGTPAEIIAKAKEYVAYHGAGGRSITADEAQVELGNWSAETNTFIPSSEVGNAVRVTARRSNESFFFAKILGSTAFDMEASAVAMANPRDIAFVVDLSGSMNDDTEPAWATETITKEFSSQGFPNVGTDLMQDLYDDFSYGTFPGILEYIGAPAGVAANKYAYAELTKDKGPLTGPSVPNIYRIKSKDNEAKRKQKAYLWMIDTQIARVMPQALPTPNSSNYAYWEKYLDYIIDPEYIHSPKPPKKGGKGKKKDKDDGKGKGKGKGKSKGKDGGGTPAPPPPPKPPIGMRQTGELILVFTPQTFRLQLQAAAMLSLMAAPGAPPMNRGWIPYKQDGDRIYRFNNPNKLTFPSAKRGLPYGYRNKIGYRTYVQFLMDHGRNLKPDGSTYVPLSKKSPHCPFHSEATPAGSFSFPPREQPMHACRRALIAAMKVIEDRNSSVPEVDLRDQVAVIKFDSLSKGNAPEIAQTLTGKYRDAMQACTDLQAVGDKGTTTATEAGLALAASHLKPESKGGKGRRHADKVVVLLTDGVPNAYQSSRDEIDEYMKDNASSEYFGGGYYWLDAALMQSHIMEAVGTDLYTVGIGLGTNYDVMDRMARLGGTGGDNGMSPRGSGNPAEYEAVLSSIFEKIIASPTARLVE